MQRSHVGRAVIVQIPECQYSPRFRGDFFTQIDEFGFTALGNVVQIDNHRKVALTGAAFAERQYQICRQVVAVRAVFLAVFITQQV